MKRKVCIMERVLLLGILGNSQSNILTLKLMDDVKKDCSFSEPEINDNNMITHADGKMTWDNPLYFKIIDIPELIEKFVEKKLVEMNGKESLTREYIKLYEMFVDKKWDEIEEAPKTDN